MEPRLDAATMDMQATDRTPVERAPAVQARGLSFAYPDGREPVIEDVSLTVAPGEFVVLIGANGTGKSTLLRVLGGLLVPTAGSVAIDGRAITDPDPGVGFVFQEPRLLPWRSVLDNVAFPLELAGWTRVQREARARGALRQVGLAGVDHDRPHQLSGGMRQRAAIARALVLEPAVLLLDEPFSALDALTRERFNVQLQAVWRETGTSIVLVTHSIPEAVFLADRILVLAGRPGRVVGDVADPLAHPRKLSDLDADLASATAARVRALLALDDEAAAAGDRP
jgi:NitT/TauT family transport system ATP-binding protein